MLQRSNLSSLTGKTSGLPHMELDPMVSLPVELAVFFGVPTPVLGNRHSNPTPWGPLKISPVSLVPPC